MKKRRVEAAMPRAASPANSGHSSPKNSVAASPPEPEAAFAAQETSCAQTPAATSLDAILHESEILEVRDLARWWSSQAEEVGIALAHRIVERVLEEVETAECEETSVDALAAEGRLEGLLPPWLRRS